MIDVDCIVWDFDGVLNANSVEGRLIWKDRLEADTGLSVEEMHKEVFNEDFLKVLAGRIDLLDHISRWTDRIGYAPGAAQLIDYWFTQDARPDAQMLALMDQLKATGYRQAIATNNEPRRTTFLEAEMGFGERVEAIFSSGRLGVLKPDRAFFDQVLEALKLPADRVFFIDDSAANVEAAARLGWQAFHFRDFDYTGLKARLGIG